VHIRTDGLGIALCGVLKASNQIFLSRFSFDINNNLRVIASITPDGKYLFFRRNGDIYWVSTKIIEKLRPVNKTTFL
jgi:hypothetical protein